MYFYPRSPCGERLLCGRLEVVYLHISIHALLAESDPTAMLLTFLSIYFYPRSPCGERRKNGVYCDTDSVFLSTLSLRRATFSLFAGLLVALYFYPRSPCGERQYWRRPKLKTSEISIHALLAESDPQHQVLWPQSNYFYPRSPCGERPLAKVRHCEGYIFLSTLSLRRAT